ncbi:Protein of unknown function DUF262 [Marinobacter sp. LV10R510-11A]|uniref:DUF262 domain-containing protein n=1 Tax=Marinobacter sp. LV10R510-11A TaxID=1415568 RepID=UPI000BB71623|nr:DUF262 domain-containing protein [Marinobacter sp. LV10R510-11A]SOB75311.1 Protein of unknown function DUF262 [Marinobacter sp. LV10R510-11A]
MRAGKYSFKELFVNRYIDQLIVPEIQRDYVWQEDQLLSFFSSIAEEFCKFQDACIPEINVDIQSDSGALLQKDFEDFFRKRNFSANIGFIYAYSDEQYQGRYFLIDGQQRITSLYLLLLILASRCGQEGTFTKHYCRAGHPLLDYRVRDATSYFLGAIVQLVLENPEVEIEDQAWYLDAYSEDASIRTMLNNLKSISSWLDSAELSEAEFFEYVQNLTEFWYFDTNISAQGENLYIYLNARGEQVQSNENLKAELLSHIATDSQKNDWGKKWEQWQDLFWKHRKLGARQRSLNADKGFNGFIFCVAALKQYLLRDRQYIASEKRRDRQTSLSVLSSILDLNDIEKYVKALEFLDHHRAEFEALYDYSDWIEKCLKELWSLWNLDSTDWFIDHHRPEVFSSETNRMVLAWGVLHSVVASLDRGVGLECLYRNLRPFYLRFHNNVRAAQQVKDSVENLLGEGFVTSDELHEEYQRENWLRAIDDTEKRRQAESIIWEIEDHPLNLDGSDVGAINITHLVTFDADLSLDKLNSIKNAFFQCFPGSSSSNKELQSLLLRIPDQGCH